MGRGTEEKMKTLIKVKRKHIINGRRGSCKVCPIAKALVEQFDTTMVNVDGEFAQVNLVSSKLPRSASRFIDRFDDGKKVKPFNFFWEANNF